MTEEKERKLMQISAAVFIAAALTVPLLLLPSCRQPETEPPTWNGWEVQCNTGCTAKLKNPPAGVEKAEIAVVPGEGGSAAHASVQIIATENYTLEAVDVKILATGLTSEKTFYKLVGRSWEQVPATEVATEPLTMVKGELDLLSSHPRYEWLKRLQ